MVSALSGQQVTALPRAGVDITNARTVTDAVHGHDVVVNCAAWTAVDDAETHESAAFQVNAVGAANVARACAKTGARMVHVSTDYVFDGNATTPYSEDAPIAPRSAYGRTKAAGEWAVRAELPERHWVVRTAWLYGAHGPNFVRTMANLERTRETVDVVTDQIGQPTWTWHVAQQIKHLVLNDAPSGNYHATSSGQTSWHGFAAAIFTALGADPDRVRPTTSAAFSRPAPRPAWSVLGHSAWNTAEMEPLPEWEAALTTAIEKHDILAISARSR
jgi:dTDP-4-dehydrorhamnose reductase